MSENFLSNPLKKIDERVHRQYEKVSSLLDKVHPKARFYLTGAINFLGYPHFVNMPLYIGRFFGVSDCAVSAYTIKDGLRANDDASDSKVKDHFLVDTYLKGSKVVRTPLFLAGSTLLGKSAYDMGKTFFTGEPLPDDFNTNVDSGLGFLYLASSMYIRDKDSKLLDKKPLLNKAKDGLEKVTETLSPEPLPGHQTSGVISKYGRIN